MKLSLETFVSRAKAQGCVWSLKDADDFWVMHEDPDDFSEAMPIWADAEFAKACAVGDWSGYEPTDIPLDNFVDDFIPALDEEAAWIGLNFGPDEQGEVIEPVELGALLREAAG